jgi:hypothetical protein
MLGWQKVKGVAMAEATFVKVLEGWEAVCHGGLLTDVVRWSVEVLVGYVREQLPVSCFGR